MRLKARRQSGGSGRKSGTSPPQPQHKVYVPTEVSQPTTSHVPPEDDDYVPVRPLDRIRNSFSSGRQSASSPSRPVPQKSAEKSLRDAEPQVDSDQPALKKIRKEPIRAGIPFAATPAAQVMRRRTPPPVHMPSPIPTAQSQYPDHRPISVGPTSIVAVSNENAQKPAVSSSKTAAKRKGSNVSDRLYNQRPGAPAVPWKLRHFEQPRQSILPSSKSPPPEQRVLKVRSPVPQARREKSKTPPPPQGQAAAPPTNRSVAKVPITNPTKLPPRRQSKKNAVPAPVPPRR